MVQFAARYPEVVLSAAVLAGLALAIQYYGYVSPHYYALGAPLLFVVMGPLLGLAARARSRATCTALAALVLFNLANGEGRFFPALDEVSQWSRGGDRSRAYLDDHRSNIAAMTRLAAVAGSTPIVTGPPYSYFLALPRLGYVAEPLAGYTTKPLAVRTFRDVRELLDDPPEELIFIHVSNIHYAYARVSIPPPEPDDEIIYRDALASPLVIYRKRLADIAPTPDERVAWLLEHLWYDETLDERPSISLVDRAGLLSAYGRHDLAARLIERGLVDRPHDARLHLRLAQLLMREGHVTAAEEHLDAALATTPDEQAPNKARIYHEVARLRIAQQQRFAAVEALERALALDPSLAVAHNDLGAIRLELSQWGEAARHFQAALAADPNLADAHYNLGLLRMAELRPGEAAEHFEATLRLRHDYPQAREQLEAARRALDSPRDME